MKSQEDASIEAGRAWRQAQDLMPELQETLDMIRDALWAYDCKTLEGLLAGPFRQETAGLREALERYLLFTGFVEPQAE